MKVVKRDGRVEDYSAEKVTRAVKAALLASGLDQEVADEKARGIAQRTFSLFMATPVRSVVDFHREVENLLMEDPDLRDAARCYIEYRHDRDNAREGKGKLYADITGFLDQSAEEFTRENANKPSSIVNTHRDLLAGILSKHVALTQILPKNLSEWHTSGYGHIHDLDYLVSPLTNCCLVNYRDMLENGFKIGNAQIEKPKSIGVATTVLTQIIQAVASSQYGGQTCAHIDEGLKQYVEMSFMKNVKQYRSHRNAYGPTNKLVYDAMQTLIYQVNTLMSVNGQSPFITISLGLDTSMFGRMITANYLKVHKEGLGKDKVTPVFPKVVFFLQEGVNMNPEDPNYDLKQLAMECCVERIYPDFISVPLNKEVTGSAEGKVTSMGCRSFLSKFTTENGEKYDGRFNLGVVSVNLPMIAAEAKQKGERFFPLLRYHMDMAYEAHMVRVKRLMDVKASQNPTLFMEGALARLRPDEPISKLFFNGYASISIGYVGLAEAVDILNGKEDKEYAMGILGYMKLVCDEYKAMTNLSFSLYGTPAESLCYRFATKLKEKFPNFIERDYLTNSFHQPVWVHSDPFSKWDYESGFANISNGGNIGYVETANLRDNLLALESLIDYGYKKIPYFGINQPVDQCLKCGHSGEFTATAKGFECPACGNHEEGTLSVIRRVSGYLSAPNSRPYNKGKMQEVVQREKHQ
ncbi:ribonucleotide reductase of class III (anaerobic), large subunit [Escherichia phage AV124]|nr:ribonucleotide reductase of class III (anaerobic), large subunit [Escherichia phage AV124]